MKDTIDTIWMAATGQFGWELCYTQWRTLLAIIAPMFRTGVENFLASLIPEDRTWISSMLNHRAWRLIRATVTALTAVQLPSVEAVNAAVARRKGDTTTISKP